MLAPGVMAALDSPTSAEAWGRAGVDIGLLALSFTKIGQLGKLSAIENKAFLGSQATRATERFCVANRGRKFWTSSTTFKGNKVFQRNDLIDLKFVDARGRTNLERMQKGLAPIGPDGKSMNLHHLTQRQNGGIAEITQTFHQQNGKTIHINPNTTPSGIVRSDFNKWRLDYWKSRANNF
ncbi:MAG: hypothetical protein S4CHLAM45_13310 [Chlamydiales bacterium]|nr:hypothetical protein [Chlamydiales bacterium]MCH9620597.1 hypothetical protein [Chlamydiales bacterium]MCH9623421.1 hypothetical protein [Chlamydiales bacterium]